MSISLRIINIVVNGQVTQEQIQTVIKKQGYGEVDYIVFDKNIEEITNATVYFTTPEDKQTLENREHLRRLLVYTDDGVLLEVDTIEPTDMPKIWTIYNPIIQGRV